MDQSTGETYLPRYQDTSVRDGTLNHLIDTIEILSSKFCCFEFDFVIIYII